MGRAGPRRWLNAPRYTRWMPRKVGTGTVAIGTMLLAVACSEPGSATPTTAPRLTTLAAVSTQVTEGSPAEDESAVGSETSAAPSASAPEYAIVTRIEGDGGDTLVVLLDPTTYTSLTDIDLENVIADVYDRFPPVLAIHVVDDPVAAELVVAGDVTSEHLEVLDEHYLAQLAEGFRIIYHGPFNDVPDSILGS